MKNICKLQETAYLESTCCRGDSDGFFRGRAKHRNASVHAIPNPLLTAFSRSFDVPTFSWEDHPYSAAFCCCRCPLVDVIHTKTV
jgi:hypothetical protein